MSQLDNAIAEISDPQVRARVGAEISKLKRSRRFGLVFEDHIPETVALPGLPVREGSAVVLRTEPMNHVRYYEVAELNHEKAVLVPAGGGEERTVSQSDLLVVKPFEEPIYPGLTHVGSVRKGGPKKPSHMVWNGENFHALQLLLFTHLGKIDVIYIDPPYNTGARDWTYNNRFVDENDSWRHSKWLSMMEKRLKLAGKLLKPDGVLIVTIDEHEVNHLGLLLEQVLPDHHIQKVTTVTNHAGVSQGAFARVEEYAFFVFRGAPRTELLDRDLMAGARSNGPRKPVYWFSLVRSGTNADPSDRPNLVYPIYIDPSTNRIVGVGDKSLAEGLAGDLQRHEFNDWLPDLNATTSEGLLKAWPIRSDRRLGNWRVGRETLKRYIKEGYVRAGAFDSSRGTYSITYLKTGAIKRIETGDLATNGRDPQTGVVQILADDQQPGFRPKTVWVDKAHDAGKQGSVILKALLGRKAFDFPKSPYLVADSIAAVSSDPKAVVLDFFAGSGTTLHVTAMLNAQDGGCRQCILVTNNDLSEVDATTLNREGKYRGDPEFEAAGVFESVTRPRVEAAITGMRPDGQPVQGNYLAQYLEDHSYADGFEENVEFFRLGYVDPDVVSLGRQYDAIAPLLWAASGAIGEWEPWDGVAPWSAPKTSTYAVLFDEDAFSDFVEYLGTRADITHVWLVTNSEHSFSDMRSELDRDLVVGMLYRDYLHNFRINTTKALR